jgi:hypothetical protein
MKWTSRKISLGLVVLILAFTTLACGAGQTAATPTFTPPASTDTVAPSPTPLPLYQTVTLTTTPFNEDSKDPVYTARADIPILQGSQDERVVRFNNEMQEITQEEISRFKDNVRQIIPMPGIAGSSFDQTVERLSIPGNLISLKFTFSTYVNGAAHPNSRTRTVNYDLETGQDINFFSLFKPGSNYLTVISNYCIAELKTRPIDFASNSDGAAPTAENYGNWNVTHDGLLITFDPYQVAAYAAGPQLVTIPYSELKSILDPNGPLAEYSH